MSLHRIDIASRLPVWLNVMACACFAMLAGGALACGTGSARAVVQTTEVASKFVLASRACAEAAEVSAVEEPASRPLATPPVDPGAHARQLSMYDLLGTTPSETFTDVAMAPLTATPASPSSARPIERAPEGPLPVKGAGRDAAARAIALVPEINRVAQAYQIDPLLLHAIAHVESRHNPEAVSRAGALGLMQVMPATARRFGVSTPQSELRNPTVSLEVCSAYLKALQKRFDNNLMLIIAAYNAGEGAVEKYGRRVPPYKETQGYVRDVMAHYLRLVDVRDSVRGNAIRNTL